jgi:serine/threonine-protein kinase
MTAPLRDLLQRALGDTVLLQRELGGGGMSRVFLARDEALGRDVVVKVLSPELAAGLSAERFTREIKLAASLQEPHIVPVLTAGATSDGLPWFTMPFVSGESLRVVLARGTVPTAEALGILRNVAQALAYAHARGIVHRDIKPDNVLLSSGTAVVADFGIAKALNASRTQANDTGNGSALTQAGMAIGTPAYMAPEQATGDSNTDHRADIYAWGVLAYELLQGAHPFADRTTPATMTAATTEVRPSQTRDSALFWSFSVFCNVLAMLKVEYHNFIFPHQEPPLPVVMMTAETTARRPHAILEEVVTAEMIGVVSRGGSKE